MADDFVEDVLEVFGFLRTQHGFEVVGTSAGLVEFRSPGIDLSVSLDPRGEVEVRAQRRAASEGLWTFTRMVGRASARRLVEMAAVALADEPEAIAGEPSYWNELADKQRAETAAWAAFHAGTGPRPIDRRLP